MIFRVNLEISLAKHKKGKSAKKPDTKDSGNKDLPPTESLDSGNKDLPPTESVDSENKDLPPTESANLEYEKIIRKKKLDFLFWFRVGLAALGGVLATVLLEPIEGEERRWASIGMLIVLFIVTIIIAKGMHLNLPRSDRKKLITTGIGSYVFIYLFVWILSYTFVHASDSEISSILFT